MTTNGLDRLLGNTGRDPGCDAAFEQLDVYAEAVRRGEDVSERFAEILTHVKNCEACREDTEAMLAAMEELERSGDAT